MLRHCWRLCSCSLRCGRDTLPQGELSQANLLRKSSETMLNVHTEQEKSVYLRGFTGGKYENGTWKLLPDAAYGGENIGMLDWLQTQGLDPFTQSAAYYRLTGDAPETNTVEVSVQNASRDVVYAPASMEKATDGAVHEHRNALLKGRGLFGTRNYTVTEVSGTRPSELMVAESWVGSPQTEEQTAYAEAESVYRSFAYDAYTAADEKMLPVLNCLFWQDYDDENDGVYSALSRIRKVLKAQVRYSETAEAAPDNADPIVYFLTDSRKGNAVLYASLTVSAGCRLMRHRAIILTRLRCSRWSACRIRCAKLRLSTKIGRVRSRWSSCPAPVVPSSPSR